MEEYKYTRFVISEGQKENKNSKRFWRRCAINCYMWSLWTQSIRWCWFKSTTFRKLALLPSSGMRLSLLGPLDIRQYRNVSSDGPSSSFRTFT